MSQSHLQRAMVIVRSYSGGIADRTAFSQLQEALHDLHQEIHDEWRNEGHALGELHEVTAAEAEASIALGLIATHLGRANQELDSFFEAMKRIEIQS